MDDLNAPQPIVQKNTHQITVHLFFFVFFVFFLYIRRVYFFCDRDSAANKEKAKEESGDMCLLAPLMRGGATDALYIISCYS